MRDKDTSALRKSHLTNGRLQHIKELVRLAACDLHLDQTKLNDLLPLTIDGVLVGASKNGKEFDFNLLFRIYKCTSLSTERFSRGPRNKCFQIPSTLL